MKGDQHVVNNNTGGFKMSRTYRRKTTDRINWACDLEHYISDLVRVPGTYNYVSVYYATDSKEYKKGYARYHSDGATSSFKEPGPSFFRNLTAERPHRRDSKEQLRKWIYNEAYEVMILSKPKLDYWT